MEFPRGIYTPALSLLTLCLWHPHALAATNVSIAPAGTAEVKKAEDAPAWHRKLWEGKFDTASDYSGAAARQLEGGLEFNCEQYQQGSAATSKTPAKEADMAAYASCMQRANASQGYAKQARSIQGQQKLFSVISKVSDVAAVGALGATIYSEIGVKKNTPADPGGQIDSYEKAARIQQKAGQVSYITGATDLTLGAYAYIAHKNKLEEMQRTITGSVGGQKATTNNAALDSSLANAVEASKKAAYSHMMYGAGKMAVGYASMYLAKRSQDQADKMVSIEEDKDYQQMLLQQRAAAGAAPVNPVVAAYNSGVGMGTPPYYNNNNPVFTMPSAQSAAVAKSGTAAVGSSGSGNSSTGSSVAPLGSARSLASANKGGGAPDSSGGSSSPGAEAAGAAEGEEAANGKDKANKEALGNFETSLTSGYKSYQGSGAHADSSKDDSAALAALMGSTTTGDGKSAATGLSPTQIFNEGVEGTEGKEAGSMAGVNAKSEHTLFVIMKEKLTKMFQVGNVGIPKNVEVKN